MRTRIDACADWTTERINLPQTEEIFMAGKPFGLSVKALIFDESNRLLALKRSDGSTHFAGQWDLPGGKLDAGEQVEQALQRESLEETGLDVEPVAFAGAHEDEMEKVRVILLFFRARANDGTVRTDPNEHSEFRWVTMDEAAALDWSPQVRPIMESLAPTD
jgi:8-oxo-dGTP diphosphatase